MSPDPVTPAPASASASAPAPRKLAVILGSVREGRYGPTVGRWFIEQARRHGGFTVDVIDLADTPLPAALPPGPDDPDAPDRRTDAMRALAERLAAAEGFVIVTPEYNHSFPASVKHLIDWHFFEWQAKPVGFVSYGAAASGLRAVEGLRLIFAEMHAVTMRDVVCFNRFADPEPFDAEGRPTAPEQADGAAKVLLDQLAWWATALHHARAKSPYTTAD